MSQYRRSGGVISRYVGGIHIDRHPPNATSGQPYTPVPLCSSAEPWKHLTSIFLRQTSCRVHSHFLSDCSLSAGVLTSMENRKIQKSITSCCAAQKSVLKHLLHPTTLQRLVDTQTYGGQYSVHEMLQTLSDGLFAADLGGNVNSYRQNVQTEYVAMLQAAMESGDYGHNIRQLFTPSCVICPSRWQQKSRLRAIPS